MKITTLGTIIFLFCSCGPGVPNPTDPDFFVGRVIGRSDLNLPAPHVEPHLERLTNEFVARAYDFGLDASRYIRVIDYFDGLIDGEMPSFSGFNSDGRSLLGVCLTIEEVNSFSKKTVELHAFVYLDSTMRENKDTMRFRALLWHELAHCYFDAPHVEEKRVASVRSRFLDHVESGGYGCTLPEMTQRPKGFSCPGTDVVLPMDEYEDLVQRFRAEYNADMRRDIAIMTPYVHHDERFWESAWEEKEAELFISLGGSDPDFNWD